MKKVLAWAVALALVLSSFTMAFAADTAKTSKDFSDADQIQYTEAVDVMVATGIINGFPDGTFGPQKTVTRSQMAKMIACIKNGGEDVGDQYKSACPFKDSQKHWAAGYIAYCASEHIIDGRSADVFDPDADVTGTEVAKMALTTLGYDSKIQGYTGETWAAAVLKDAKKVGLFEGLDKSFVPGDPCSREAAAQILFNMLKAVEVEYTNGTSVAIGDDISVVVASDMNDQTWPGTDLKANPPKYDKNDDTKDGLKQLYEDVFGGKLSQNKADKDDFGRPAHSWTYPDKKTEVGEYVDEADYEFTATAAGFEAAVKAYDKDLAKELKTGTVKVNGTSGTVALGDKVELFVKSDNTYEAVVTQYKPARITKVNTNVKENKDGITAELTLEGAITKANNKMAGYDESTYVEGAVIAVALGQKNAIMDSYVMEEAAKGEVTKTTTAKYTIDGKDYEVRSDCVNFDGAVKPAKDKVYILYDYNGYVLATAVEKEAEPVIEYFYGVIAKTGTGSTEWSEDTGSKKVQMFTSEGEFEPLTISADAKAEKIEKYKQYDFVVYTLNEDGEIDSLALAKPNTGIDGKAVKEGTLNGSEVAEAVAVFDIIKAPEEGATAIKYKDTKDWAVLGLSDLEAAEKVFAQSSFQDEKDGSYVALLLSKPLTEEASPFVYELGFISSVSDYETADGEFATINVWQEGKEVPYTTAKKVYNDAFDTKVKGFDPDQLVKVKLQDNEVLDVEEVTALERSIKPVDKFAAERTDAAVYTADPDCDATTDANDYTVVSKTTSTQLVFGKNKVNKQTVSKATIYALKDGKLEVSKIGDITPNALAKVYQIDAESGVWNIVVYAPSVTFTSSTESFGFVGNDALVPVDVAQDGTDITVTNKDDVVIPFTVDHPAFPAEWDGHYIAVKMTVNREISNDATITLSGNGTYSVKAALDEGSTNEITYIIYATPLKKATADFDWDGDGTVDEAYTIDVSGLELASIPN